MEVREPGENGGTKNANNTDILSYLYDKRLTLFDDRRAHEWKILISVVTLLLITDAGLITQKVCLKDVPGGTIGWLFAIFVLAASCALFELGIQTRNRVDRIAMHDLNNALCDSLSPPTTFCPESYVRHPPDHAGRGNLSVAQFGNIPAGLDYAKNFLWAYVAQVAVLGFIGLVSVLIVPGVACHLLAP